MERGVVIFITFEGIDCSGKSTQVRLLEDDLKKKGFQVLVTQEPGGTALGQKFRKIFLEQGNFSMNIVTEIFLIMADRVQHIEECVLPALDKGTIVICDRFLDSTFAYQALSDVAVEDFIENIVKLTVCSQIVPDITFLLDLDSQKSGERSGSFEKDRFTNRGQNYLEKVREAYLRLKEKHSHRIHLIDASVTKDTVFQNIKRLLYENPFFLD